MDDPAALRSTQDHCMSEAYALRRQQLDAAAAPVIPAGNHIINNEQFVQFVQDIGTCRMCGTDSAMPLQYFHYVSRSRAFVFRCRQCHALEEFVTAPQQQVMITGPDGEPAMRRFAADSAAGVMSGAGYPVYRRLLGMLELPYIDEKTFHKDSTELLLPAICLLPSSCCPRMPRATASSWRRRLCPPRSSLTQTALSSPWHRRRTGLGCSDTPKPPHNRRGSRLRICSPRSTTGWSGPPAAQG
jgi:hypothetical protein